jgi:hypothetical protein
VNVHDYLACDEHDFVPPTIGIDVVLPDGTLSYVEQVYDWVDMSDNVTPLTASEISIMVLHCAGKIMNRRDRFYLIQARDLLGIPRVYPVWDIDYRFRSDADGA